MNRVGEWGLFIGIVGERHGGEPMRKHQVGTYLPTQLRRENIKCLLVNNLEAEARSGI